MESYSTIRNKELIHATTWMNLKNMQQKKPDTKDLSYNHTI